MEVGFFLMAVLLARLSRPGESSDLEIMLLSNASYQTPSKVTNQLVDVLADDDPIFIARYHTNSTVNVEIAIQWFKDGKRFAVPDSYTYVICNFPSPQICSVSLALHSIDANRSANYTALMRSREPEIFNVSESAWISVTVGNLTNLNFTSHPPALVYSSSNSSTRLQYLAYGFPRPTYSLTCRNAMYSVNMSGSGMFELPPLNCTNTNLNCHAVASNGYGEPVSSPDTLLVPEDSCASRKSLQEGRGLIVAAAVVGTAIFLGLAAAAICIIKRSDKLRCNFRNFPPEKWSLSMKLCPEHFSADLVSKVTGDGRDCSDGSVGALVGGQQTERPACVQLSADHNASSACYMDTDGASSAISDGSDSTCVTQLFQSPTTQWNNIRSTSQRTGQTPLPCPSHAPLMSTSLLGSYCLDFTASLSTDFAGTSLSATSPAAQVQIINHYVMVGDNNKMYVGESDRDVLAQATGERRPSYDEPEEPAMDSPMMPYDQPVSAEATVSFCLEMAPTSHSSLPEAEMFGAFKEESDVQIVEPLCDVTRHPLS